jgi:peptidoglycan/xylan/chitin deacetylase (PgdA/CDA1 family)
MILKKTISLSFDDGREDLYRNAFPIMKKYDLVSSAHVVTGFIDGTFKPTHWHSCDGAITIEQLYEMKNLGHEISSHGDRHISEIDDFNASVDKLMAMNLAPRGVGFAVPGSKTNGVNFPGFVDHLKNHRHQYIRMGAKKRKNHNAFTQRAIRKATYILDTHLGIFWGSYLLNKNNVIDLGQRVPVHSLPSLAVHIHDNPRKWMYFIERMPDNTWLIIMLHGILGVNEPHYGKDIWCWSTENFESLCGYLSKRQEEGKLAVKTISNQLDCL